MNNSILDLIFRPNKCDRTNYLYYIFPRIIPFKDPLESFDQINYFDVINRRNLVILIIRIVNNRRIYRK